MANQRDLKKEFPGRAKKGVLAVYGKDNMTDMQLDAKTWKYGFDWVNADGTEIYNGVTFVVDDLQVRTEKPSVNPTAVFSRLYVNRSKDPVTFKPQLTEAQTVKDSVTITFKESFSIGVEEKVGVKIEGIGEAAESVKVDATLEAGQQISNEVTHTISQSESFDITVEPGTSKRIEYIWSTGTSNTPFQATIRAQGHFFYKAWWDNDGGRRWAGWPKEDDQKNPFCGAVDELMNGSLQVWNTDGVFSQVEHFDGQMTVSDGPAADTVDAKGKGVHVFE